MQAIRKNNGEASSCDARAARFLASCSTFSIRCGDDWQLRVALPLVVLAAVERWADRNHMEIGVS